MTAAHQPWLYPLCTTVSALFVRPDGPYQALVEDCWDESRDARLYAGPHPVVAHPPCARWGRFATFGGGVVGADGGCFVAALTATRTWGGVLEHPEASKAWDQFGLLRPVRRRWTGGPREWVAVVDQLAYGHRARKRTWLLYVGEPPPELIWDSTPGKIRVYCASGPRGSETRSSRVANGIELMGKSEREMTPWPFARLLVDLARGAR